MWWDFCSSGPLSPLWGGGAALFIMLHITKARGASPGTQCSLFTHRLSELPHWLLLWNLFSPLESLAIIFYLDVNIFHQVFYFVITQFFFSVFPNLSHGHRQSCDTRVNLRKGSTYIPFLSSEHTPVHLLCLFTWSIIKGNILYVFNYGGPARYNYFLFFIPRLPQDMYFMINFMLWWARALATLT